jgi:hypothetical protein
MRRRGGHFSVALLVALLAFGCGEGDSGGEPPPSGAPEIAWFLATPSTTVSGQASTLDWNVSGATSMSINQGVGTVVGLSVIVSPTTTTTYTLTATNAVGSVSADTTVTVVADPIAP